MATKILSKTVPFLDSGIQGSETSYSIREASRVTQVPNYVLRYWESKKIISPAYTTRGHRRYRAQDVERILKVKDWIYARGMTAAGARKALIEESRPRPSRGGGRGGRTTTDNPPH